MRKFLEALEEYLTRNDADVYPPAAYSSDFINARIDEKAAKCGEALKTFLTSSSINPLNAIFAKGDQVKVKQSGRIGNIIKIEQSGTNTYCVRFSNNQDDCEYYSIFDIEPSTENKFPKPMYSVEFPGGICKYLTEEGAVAAATDFVKTHQGIEVKIYQGLITVVAPKTDPIITRK